MFSNSESEEKSDQKCFYRKLDNCTKLYVPIAVVRQIRRTEIQKLEEEVYTKEYLIEHGVKHFQKENFFEVHLPPDKKPGQIEKLIEKIETASQNI